MSTTKNLIKHIGITCIVLGTFGLGNALSGLILMTMQGAFLNDFPDTPAILIRWTGILSGIGVLVNILVITAGIFFLARRPWSLILIYAALALSILFKIIPMAFLSRYSAGPFMNYHFYIFNLIRPLLDTLLLLGALWVRKDFLLPAGVPRDEKRKLSPRLLKSISIAGFACLLVPLSIFGLWHYVSAQDISRPEMVELYKSYFPGFLRGQWSTSYLSLAFSVLGIILSSVGLQPSNIHWKAFNIGVLVLCILFFGFYLFTLM